MSNFLMQRAGLSRRRLLAGSVAAGVLAAMGGAMVPVPTLAATPGPDEFLRLSQFLTGKALDKELGARYLAALTRQDASFLTQAASLQDFVTSAKAADIDALLALPEMQGPLKQTATKIVSAWYLGIVGEAEKAELVSYANALMYRPTRGALIVPTYGGGPESWGAKPVVEL